MTDQELLKNVEEKDSQSFKILYNRYCNLLNGWAYSRLKNKEATADIMQEFWTFIWLNPQRISPDENGSAKKYLQRSISFRILKYFHKQSVKLEFANDEIFANQVSILSYTHVQEELNAKEIQELIDNVLESLPKLSQQIFNLRFTENFSIKETASALDIAESTVRNNFSTVVSVLRTEVAKHYKTSCTEKIGITIPLLIWILENKL